jgi:hypothetical protein
MPKKKIIHLAKIKLLLHPIMRERWSKSEFVSLTTGHVTVNNIIIL